MSAGALEARGFRSTEARVTGNSESPDLDAGDSAHTQQRSKQFEPLSPWAVIF